MNVDTTVQENAVAFPTDARLHHKMRQALVKEASKENIKLRQSYKNGTLRLDLSVKCN
ncbi:hypothetical protein LEP1GSC038_0021 [Leptospira weilii str. 2006001855]|uniref:Uncharacterized protein n=1 Tax=Leptospira weilii str. 2006001855 TaxID=996804 RepID=M6FU65_9LEPT|nr:hypothetical protein LEP1GSC038_0021 [Leptospira weilii str. 2006001855]